MNKTYNRLLQTLQSHRVGIALIWIVLGLGLIGTYLLSRDLDLQGLNSASVYSSADVVHHVSLYKDRIMPTELVVRAGDEIVFTVKDDSSHNIAEDRSHRNDARLQSGEFGKGESYSLVFQTTGVMSFYDRQNQDLRIIIEIK